MKIGVITYHQVYNYGSCLQAYATQKVFEDMGATPEIINYVPKRYINYGSFKQIYNESKFYHSNILKCLLISFLKMPSYKAQSKSFQKFEKYLKLTQTVTDETIGILSDKYDLYCTGSDQVWNNFFVPRFIKPYFLEFANEGKRCIAYAASFGKSSFNDEEKLLLKNYLKKYEHISVREKSAKKIIESLGYQDIKQVLDPVYMLSKEEWRKLQESISVPKQYILVYQLHHDSKAVEIAEKLSKKTGIEILRIKTTYHQRGKHKSVMLPSVNQFLTLIDRAAYIVTDSFHGTSFSINFEKQFYVTYPSKFSTRIQSVLELFGLTDRVVENNFTEGEIDYGKVNSELNKFRKDNLDYLRSVLFG